MSAFGTTLRVDLTDRTVTTERIDDELVETYLGGTGLAARILYDELEPGVDPLGPANKLVFATGPITGTRAPTSGRHSVSALSPLTGILGEATSGGDWGSALRRAGFDLVIVEGEADDPVYLHVEDGEYELRDASDLWGLDVPETTERIQDDVGEDAVVSTIGRAGENEVRFAAVMNDVKRAAGRTGMGAVMGAKQLKAISVIGTGDPHHHIDDTEAYRDLTLELTQTVTQTPSTKTRRDHGTAAAIEEESEVFDNLPTKYFEKGEFDGAWDISGPRMSEDYLTNVYACGQCPIACGRVVSMESDRFGSLSDQGGPEYETLASFGSLSMNDDFESIARANELCNRYGLDTISAGHVVAFAIAAQDRGLVDENETGMDLDWGNEEEIVELVHRIADRDGFGDVLADGVVRAASAIDGEEHALHVKGLELPMHEPRAQKTMGLTYATSNRGACHMRAFTGYVDIYGYDIPDLEIYSDNYPRHASEGKAELEVVMQNLFNVYDSMCGCKFSYPPGTENITVAQLADLLGLATGRDMDRDDVLELGDRIFTMKRLFNVREGISREDDRLPSLFTDEAHEEGSNAGEVVELAEMLEEYYERRGWDDEGRPTDDHLAEIGMAELA
ncbi:aldehyde ferredoxin oxidoreductase family protein [Halosolutus amylolyticus]|uniref:Aldehyde ferredoxin oxidoreductase family protein n=1 Tax=Halosolutus amylolyticus TaxID=2932267 RepID=A0ABD5PKA2_9EURY|nr:aldehyde ferredoxin oxidoreductase family protein [Halosolutus amylolyticus]